MTMRVAVIGAGAIAGSHMKALQEIDELQGAALCDKDPVKAEQLLAQSGLDSMRVYGDYKEMVRQERPDIVAINLPHFLHKEAAVFCAEHGCHMMLEKPMAMNAQECDDIIEAARRAGVTLMIGHTQRYLPENRKAKQIIDSGALGELIMVNDVRYVGYYADTRPDWFFRRELAGGGIVMNLGSHSIDKIQWLSGSTAVKVKASVTYLGTKGDVEGSGHLWMTLSGGASATVSLCGYGGVNRNDTEFVFTEGMLNLQQNRGLWISKDGAYEQVPLDDEPHPFVLQYRDLLNSIRTKEALDVTPEYSRGIISIVHTAYESHRLGQELTVPGA